MSGGNPAYWERSRYHKPAGYHTAAVLRIEVVVDWDNSLALLLALLGADNKKRRYRRTAAGYCNRPSSSFK